MRFMKIIKGKPEPVEVSEITFEMIRREVGGNVKPIDIHANNARYIVMWVEDGLTAKKKYKNFILNGNPIFGHAILVVEKRGGEFISMSDHELNSLKIFDGEFITLFPSHTGFMTHTRPPR
jgi:hypothetical protein